MSLIFKPNMLVIITRGRHASSKAIIVNVLEDSRLLIVGYSRSKKIFIKRMNPLHVLATSHSLSLDLSVPLDVFTTPKTKRDTIEMLQNLIENRTEPSAVWMKEKLMLKQ